MVNGNGKVYGVSVGVIVLVIAILMLVFGGFYNVPEGSVGVKFVKLGNNKGFVAEELDQGVGMKIPFKDTVSTIPFRTQEIGFYGGGEKGTYSSIQPKDINGINFFVDVTVRYQLDAKQASEFTEQKGEGISTMEQLLATATRADSTRGVFGKYAQEDVPENRIEIAQEIRKVLQERIDSEASGKLLKGFITIEAVDLRNVQFDPRIEEAIVNKQTQKQVAERKEYELQAAVKEREIAIVQADKERQAKVLIAQGEAAAVREVAFAKADGIEAINRAYQAMPAEYVSVKWAEAIKPNDKVIFGLDSLGSNSLPFLDVGKVSSLYATGATN